MALFKNPRSPFWWMYLEGHGRLRESTGIRWNATSAEQRKKNRDAAEEIYHARMIQLARDAVGLPKNTGETFERFSRWYETHHTAKHSHTDRELGIIERLRLHFGRLAMSDIKAARWTEYETARIAEGVAKNTVGRELAVMKAILNAAVGEHLEVNPLANVKRVTQRVPPKRTITAAEEKRLLQELHDDEQRDLYLVGVGTLLRQMNLIELQRHQYHGTRLVVTTKTGPHQVPLTGPTVLQKRAAAVLRRRLPNTPHGFFFPKWHERFSRVLTQGERRKTRRRDDDRRAAGNKLFLQQFRRACTRAGIPWGLKTGGVVWHTATRASGATRLMREFGVDLRTVQLIGGWKSLDQMAAYLGVDLSRASETASKSRRRA